MKLQKLLNEIDEKQKIINAYWPLINENLRFIRDFFRLEMVYTSNIIEGYNYSLAETKTLLEKEITAAKPLKDMFAVLGLAKAYDHMFTLIENEHITKADILFFHECLGNSLYHNSIGGSYRENPGYISNSQYSFSEPENIDNDIETLMACSKLESASTHPVLFAAEVHKRFAFIHPFADGNGRVAWLLMNTCLLQKGFLPTMITPIMREEYINCLEKARIDERDFYSLICERELATQKELIKFLKL